MVKRQHPPEILIIGGTGLLGKEVCRLFDIEGITYTIGTHQKKNNSDKYDYLDFATGNGIKNAISGKKIILHLASDKKNPDNDVAGTKALLAELKQSPLLVHFIYISIVGSDLLDLPYFKQKWRVEQEITKSGVPYSILRATQFHEYIDQVLSSLLSLPIGFIPKRLPIQPISIEPVAAELMQLSQNNPTWATQNLGGKDILFLEEAANKWLAIRNKKRWVFNLPTWGTWGKNLKEGALTCVKKTDDGLTWKDWLKSHSDV